MASSSSAGKPAGAMVSSSSAGKPDIADDEAMSAISAAGGLRAIRINIQTANGSDLGDIQMPYAILRHSSAQPSLDAAGM